MEEEIFYLEIKQNFEKKHIKLSEKQINQFYTYMKLLQKWNEKINLTTITEMKDIIIKHFLDSCSIIHWVPKYSRIIDVGTGAGFPGIPVHILMDGNNTCLLDSLNKRINFLQEIIEQLELNLIQAVHGRAEEKGQECLYRENYDVVVSRAVAPLNILAEYCLPFAKKNGRFICMKGPNIENEVRDAKKSISILGGEIEEIEEISIGDDDLKRNIICIRKTRETPKTYPRKAGKPSKSPII